MIGSDILSVLFLAFVAIIIAGLVYKLAPSHSMLIVPSFVFICIGLWIAYDYVLLKRYVQKDKWLKSKYDRNMTDAAVNVDDTEISQMIDEINRDTYSDKEILSHSNFKQPDIVKQNDCDIDIDIYNQNVDFRDMYQNMGGLGDNRLANRMKYMSLQPKLSANIRASFNKYSLQPYVEEELRENENRDWWENDALDAVF
jgi:hypothetical protein